jgi:hypothetical protein
MKRTMILLLLVALMVVALAVPALAAGKGYGKTVQDVCGYTYGEAVSAGKQAANSGGHPEFTPSGAKGVVEAFLYQASIGDPAGIVAAHCPALLGS